MTHETPTEAVKLAINRFTNTTKEEGLYSLLAGAVVDLAGVLALSALEAEGDNAAVHDEVELVQLSQASR